MVSEGARDAHQLSGVASSFSGNTSICQGEEGHRFSGQNRQHLCQGLYKSLWGTHSWLTNALTVETWKWSIDRQIFLMAECLPAVQNQVADMESRTIKDRCDWMLHPHLFSQIERRMGPLEVDTYVCISANTPAPSLLQLEARSGSRNNRCLYTELGSVSWVCQFPMVSHITKAKIQQDKVRVILVVPMWRTQPWYPLLL